MPMEDIHLGEAHAVHKLIFNVTVKKLLLLKNLHLKYFWHGYKVSGSVQHDSSVRKVGSVFNLKIQLFSQKY